MLEKATYYDKCEPGDEEVIKKEKQQILKRVSVNTVEEGTSKKRGRSDTELTKEMKELWEKLKKLEGGLEEPGEKAKSVGKCFCCGQLNHIERHCYSKYHTNGTELKPNGKYVGKDKPGKAWQGQ